MLHLGDIKREWDQNGIAIVCFHFHCFFSATQISFGSLLILGVTVIVVVVSFSGVFGIINSFAFISHSTAYKLAHIIAPLLRYLDLIDSAKCNPKIDLKTQAKKQNSCAAGLGCAVLCYANAISFGCQMPGMLIKYTFTVDCVHTKYLTHFILTWTQKDIFIRKLESIFGHSMSEWRAAKFDEGLLFKQSSLHIRSIFMIIY